MSEQLLQVATGGAYLTYTFARMMGYDETQSVVYARQVGEKIIDIVVDSYFASRPRASVSRFVWPRDSPFRAAR